jgi:hypothetical protein
MCNAWPEGLSPHINGMLKFAYGLVAPSRAPGREL